MTLANECIPFYEPGDRVTAKAGSTVTGKQLVAVSATRDSDGRIVVAPATAAGRVFGVASHDAATGEVVTIIREGIVPITATNATISAFGEVEVATGGKVVAKSSGVAIGYVITDCAANGEAQVALY